MRHLIADFDAGPKFGFGEIAINLPQSRFWITSCLPTLETSVSEAS